MKQKPSPQPQEASAGLEAAAAAHDRAHYILRLYITGTTLRSTRAIINIRKIREEHLYGRYDLEVVDISQKPTLAEGEKIIAAPSLIKKLPLPLRRFIGDMSQTERFLIGPDLRDGTGAPSGFLGVSREIAGRKQAEESLRANNEELTRSNRVAVGRQLRMIELKKEINELCDATNQPRRYPGKRDEGTPQ